MKHLLLAALLAVASPAFGQSVLQTVTASQNGTALPPSTGQATDLATCQGIVSDNLAAASGYGYTVNGGSFTDPASGITITQGCDTSGAYVGSPAHPFAGAQPTPGKVGAPPIGVCTDIWFIFGQSNASNSGYGRYTSAQPAGAGTWAYGGGGNFYQLGDPIVGATGTDAGPWARLADLMLGEPSLNPSCTAGINRVVVINRAIGGTSIAEWGPGGDENAYLLAQLNDAVSHGLRPTRLLWVQGEADAGSMSTATYVSDFGAMMQSVRGAGVMAPVYVSTTTVCNYRDAANPSPMNILTRTPDWYIAEEQGRLAIRAAQAELVNGMSVRAGPNTDTIPWQYRAEGDGCHFGPAGLDEHARRWAAVLSIE